MSTLFCIDGAFRYLGDFIYKKLDVGNIEQTLYF